MTRVLVTDPNDSEKLVMWQRDPGYKPAAMWRMSEEEAFAEFKKTHVAEKEARTKAGAMPKGWDEVRFAWHAGVVFGMFRMLTAPHPEGMSYADLLALARKDLSDGNDA